jgi:hypothetical protein
MLHHRATRAVQGPRELKTPALHCSHFDKPVFKCKPVAVALADPAVRTYYRSRTGASRLKGYCSAINQSATRLGPRAVSVLHEQPAHSLSPSARRAVVECYREGSDNSQSGAQPTASGYDDPERGYNTASEGASTATPDRPEHTAQQHAKPKQAEKDPQLVVDVDKHAVVQVLAASAARRQHHCEVSCSHLPADAVARALR